MTDEQEPQTAVEVYQADQTPAAAYPDIPPKVVGGLPYAAAYMKLAKTIQSTEMVPKVLRGRPDAIMAAMMTGYELGLGPMQALGGIHVIEGRPTLSAELMRALIAEAGHTFILSATNTEATVKCRRTDWPEGEWSTFTFSMDDAKQAGLAGKDNWKKYPRAMLMARATAEAARAIFPDVLAGLSYTPEEITDMGRPIPQAAAPPDEDEVVDGEIIPAVSGEIVADVAYQEMSATAGMSGPGVPMVTNDQRVKIFAMAGAAKGDAHNFAANALDKDVTSINHLTRAEASTVIEYLEAL